jgi:hypothetical protein
MRAACASRTQRPGAGRSSLSPCWTRCVTGVFWRWVNSSMIPTTVDARAIATSGRPTRKPTTAFADPLTSENPPRPSDSDQALDAIRLGHLPVIVPGGTFGRHPRDRRSVAELPRMGKPGRGIPPAERDSGPHCRNVASGRSKPRGRPTPEPVARIVLRPAEWLCDNDEVRTEPDIVLGLDDRHDHQVLALAPTNPLAGFPIAAL